MITEEEKPNSFVKWKLRMQIAASLFSMVGMPYLVASQAHEQLHNAGIVHPDFIIIMLFGFVLLLTVGWFYDVSGLWAKENGYSFKKNDEWQKMRRKQK